MTKGAAVNVRLTERQRTLLEMRAAGYYWQEIEDTLDEEWDDIRNEWLLIESTLGAISSEHAIALAIRGGHIL
jgi:hypothetical protein